MPITVIASGRRDVENYFQISGIRECQPLTHTPLLAFVVTGSTVAVKIIERADQLLEYPDETQVMGQWRREWRSDYFQFTVGQFRAHIRLYPRQFYQLV